MTDPPLRADFVVIGAGILGLAVARELLARHPDASLCVLEREDRVGAHQTSHSSGVIHAGIYYAPGSLKARLCVEGAGLLYAYCEERGIEARRNGKLIVATAGSELPRLDELERRGHANQVPDLRRVGPDEISEIEPHARGVSALHSPATGVVDFGRVAEAFAADVEAAGGVIVTGSEVRGLSPGSASVAVEHRGSAVEAGLVVSCAGAWSDRLAVAAGAPPEPRIVPFRGAYLLLRPERRELVRANIYPVPDPDLPFLGGHLTRGIDGEVLLGPSALMVGARDAYRLGRVRWRDLTSNVSWPGTWRLVGRFWRTGLTELRHAASRRAFVTDLRRFVPELEVADVLPGPSGIRAQAVDRDGRLVDDFVVHRTERALHVRNAPSPAATSSLALAKLIADQAEGR
ncbi:MAG TPA: L-2-hydroxyglutarate oxidase [Solirubrobacterales bacterium]|jgi:2-hydroxyglutarate dehydrogenase|nr:L-2-hydroxyglutarate oxidase [Solirubrobacterales bacterium]